MSYHSLLYMYYIATMLHVGMIVNTRSVQDYQLTASYVDPAASYSPPWRARVDDLGTIAREQGYWYSPGTNAWIQVSGTIRSINNKTL